MKIKNRIIILITILITTFSFVSCNKNSSSENYDSIVIQANKDLDKNCENNYLADTEDELEERYEEKFTLSKEEKNISDICSEYMESIDFQGSVLVGIGDKIIFQNGYGYADEKVKTKNTADSVYQIASLTKQFTATGILILQEQGKLKITDKLSKYLPGFTHGDKLTIENLLFMSSGLQDFADSFILDNQKPDKNYKVGFFYDLIKDFQLYFTPGATYEYCNTNYYILGMIIEKASGMSYEDFITKNIFKPMNMTMSTFDNKKVTSKGYSWGKEYKTIYDKSVFYASGAMCSTVEDMFRWLRGLNNEQILNKDTLNYVRNNESDLGYSCGWTVSDKTKQHHSGNLSGYRTYDAISYENDVKVVVLSNNEQITPSYIGNVLIDIVNENLSN